LTFFDLFWFGSSCFLGKVVKDAKYLGRQSRQKVFPQQGVVTGSFIVCRDIFDSLPSGVKLKGQRSTNSISEARAELKRPRFGLDFSTDDSGIWSRSYWLPGEAEPERARCPLDGGKERAGREPNEAELGEEGDDDREGGE